MPKLGDQTRRCDLGMAGTQIVEWSACPLCGHERWVNRTQIPMRCKKCAGEANGKNPNFHHAKHPKSCNCQRCKTERGELTREKNPAWKGGRIKTPDGYITIRLPKDHPYYSMTYTDSLVLEHRLVMAEYLGRALKKGETVHHRNGIKDDNRIENLELWIGSHGSGQRFEDIHCKGCTCFSNKEQGS
jgi:hypothetical protein